MNTDYTYCTGFGSIRSTPLRCLSCRRHIPFGSPVPDGVRWWTAVFYDPSTGRCPMYDPLKNIAKCHED